MSAIKRSVLLSLADSYLGLALQIASTVIVSRLLTPAEVGVFAIAAVFSALASMFRDFGVAEYLIQERELDDSKVRAALALNIVASWSMAALLVLMSPLAASFYGQPDVGRVMRVLALSFLLIPFGAVTMAWYRRQLDYVPIAACNVMGSIASFVAVVAMAAAGWGTMSLAWSQLVGIAVVVTGTVIWRPKNFPRWPSFQRIGEVFHFSKFASSIYVLGQVGKSAPEAMLGRVAGPVDVAMYSRGYGLVEMLNRFLMKPVMQVCLPYFAQHQRESGTVAPAYVRSVSILTAAGWPFLATMAVLAQPAIWLIYGEQWMAAVGLARVLCLAAAVELLYALSREALMAAGEARRANDLQLMIVGALLLGLVPGLAWGVQGLCWGMVLAHLAGLAASLWQLRRTSGLTVAALWRGCLPALPLTLVTAGPAALAALWLPMHAGNHLAWLGLGGGAAAAAWLLGLRWVRHPLWAEVQQAARRLPLGRWRA